MGLTVGQVSGLIAVGVFLLRISLVLLLGILVATLLPDENTAVTWSVANGLLQSTPWSSLLRTDAKASKNVSRRIQLLSLSLTLSLLLLGIASIVTPLGLYDEVAPGKSTKVTFEYVSDNSSFGLGTPPRPGGPITRLCGGPASSDEFFACPGSSSVDGFDGVGAERRPISGRGNYSTTVPTKLEEIFSSISNGNGRGKTISGLFDIQYRQYYSRSYDNVDEGRPYISGVFRSLDNIVLNDKLEVVEGLVLDSVNGGVGYRNHTIPSGLPQGGVWSEDLTWIQPVTECVDTNLTLDYSIEYDVSGELQAKDIVLKDHGGLSNLRPLAGRFNTDDVQTNPDLLGRAHVASWYINAMALVGLNMSTIETLTEPRNIKPDQSYPVSFGSGGYRPDSIQIAALEDALPAIGVYNTTGDEDMKRYLGLGQDVCEGVLVLENYNPGSREVTHIACGALYTAPQRTDGGDPRILQPLSKWTQHIHACASSAKASVKTVDFSFNGTASMRNLVVTGIHDKKYKDDASKPLWAVEVSNKPLNQTSRLWGIVDDAHEKNQGIVTRRAEHVYIPAIDRLQGPRVIRDNIAATSIFGIAMNSVYGTLHDKVSSSADITEMLITDYSGRTNFGILQKWQSLSANASMASRIINLIFTDIVTSGTVGTKSTISSGSTTSLPTGDDSDDKPNGAAGGRVNNDIVVRQYENNIKYNLLYGIPAFLILLVWIVVLSSALLASIFSCGRVSRIKQLLNQLSPGRIVTGIQHPELCDSAAPTKEWEQSAGGVRLRLGKFGSTEGAAVTGFKFR
ncbi:hypothetical protein AJ79_00210 [Helicocarpus griseus UAMH5409]|uniref:Uncharacterized protein n=1 Tax=Helicocarpus griseus UAMH5409 TaxID=1447875 RepID=A0A2B7YDW5_9EURO|nr:hypothetical protein AJ79_00210 [Helicocarpus griseus UAMH5409]